MRSQLLRTLHYRNVYLPYASACCIDPERGSVLSGVRTTTDPSVYGALGRQGFCDTSWYVHPVCTAYLHSDIPHPLIKVQAPDGTQVGMRSTCTLESMRPLASNALSDLLSYYSL